MFPSGTWTGFWSYNEDGSDMLDSDHPLTLTFDGEAVAGGGLDNVGPFTVTGTALGDRIEVSKQYTGEHQVGYHGRLGFRGCVVGRWRIGASFGGRFIWVPPGANGRALAKAYANTLAGEGGA